MVCEKWLIIVHFSQQSDVSCDCREWGGAGTQHCGAAARGAARTAGEQTAAETWVWIPDSQGAHWRPYQGIASHRHQGQCKD